MLKIAFLVGISILLAICIGIAVAEKHLKLPPYIKPCSKSAPDFDDCCLQHATEALPTFVKGDKKYHIPVMTPLIIASAEMDAGSFKVSFSDLHIYGIETIELKKVNYETVEDDVDGRNDLTKFDMEKNEFSVHGFLDKVNFIGKYDCNGQILILPIQGQGDMNVTMMGLDVTYNIKYKLEEKDGDEYIVIADDAVLELNFKRVYYDLKNLFGGNNDLADVTLKALNDEWEKFTETLKPILSQSIVAVIQSIAIPLTGTVSFKDLFLD